MANDYLKAALKGVPDTDLAEVLRRLVAKNLEFAEEANAELNGLRCEMAEKAKTASEVGEISEKQLSSEQTEKLLQTVKARFEVNMPRHESMDWAKVQARLEASPEKMWSLNEMERTGGEPDVIGYDDKTGEYIFFDCSEESPKGRRNLCYDRNDQERAESYGYKPAGNAVDMAKEMGIKILGQMQYREVLGKLAPFLRPFDQMSYNWLETPVDRVRSNGGLIVNFYRLEYSDVSRHRTPKYFGFCGFRGSLRV